MCDKCLFIINLPNQTGERIFKIEDIVIFGKDFNTLYGVERWKYWVQLSIDGEERIIEIDEKSYDALIYCFGVKDKE